MIGIISDRLRQSFPRIVKTIKQDYSTMKYKFTKIVALPQRLKAKLMKKGDKFEY